MGAPPPIVFIGPSLPRAEAERILAAAFRPPVRRGDLEVLEKGSVVAIIDGVFDQDLSISPTEIRNAVLRGVRVVGCSSMGALRAAEVPEMEGFGRVFQMFKDGVIEDDDEVALTFDPDSFRATSEPMVNVRYAIEQLRRPGTIDGGTADSLLKAAKHLHYRDRVYPLILRKAGLSKRADSDVLLSLLRTHDLKREDAVSLLERLPSLPARQREARGNVRTSYGPKSQDHHSGVNVPAVAPPDASVFFWEYGEVVPFSDIVLLLQMTGEFPRIARRAVSRFALAGNEVEADFAGGPDADARAEDAIARLRRAWNWESAEEAKVTLRDLGIGLEDQQEALEQEVGAELTLMGLARASDPAFSKALRAELLFDNLALKRAAVRSGTLRAFAERARRPDSPPSDAELRGARELLCERLDASEWGVALRHLAWWGVGEAHANGFAETLALARRTGGEVLSRMFGRRAARPGSPNAAFRMLGLKSRRKQPGDPRFCTPARRGYSWAQKLRPVVGITRVAVITGLDVVGLPNANAYRPTGTWSSTIGSGKSESITGAKTGAIMEEVEKWAQEQYPGSGLTDAVEGSYEELSRRTRCVDPALLDLPHDTCYRPDLPIRWLECMDLIGRGRVLAPLAAFAGQREKNDIFFSAWLGRASRSTNGLASGFTLEEALTHGVCEVIERHATILEEVVNRNPGGPGAEVPRAVDLETAPRSTRRIVARLERAGRVRVFDITSEVRVPTFHAIVFIPAPNQAQHFGWDYKRAAGHATHPDPEVAANMALLEASQTIVVPIAGGREDLTLFARSLGRHQRTRAHTRAGYAALGSADPRSIPFSALGGLRSRDVLEDIAWIVQRLEDVAVPHLLVADLSRPEIAPARVIRTVIPGLQTTNTVMTSLRVRARLVEDLMPRR